jgi:hypothetical protein
MNVDPKIEDPTRTMIGQAVRGELPELDRLIGTVGDQVYGMSAAYCVLAAAYLAIDVCGRWPTDSDIRGIARLAASSSSRYILNEQDVYDYIARMALIGEPMNHVVASSDVDVRLPVLVTAQLLVAFCPKGTTVWEYLDTIWNAFNAAEHADMSILPALLIRQKQIQAGV